MKLLLLFLSVSSATFISSCKKKDEPTNKSANNVGNSCYITAKIDGVQKEFHEGEGYTEAESYNHSDEYPDGSRRVYYHADVSPGGHNPFFEFSLNDIIIPDGDDRDQLTEIFTLGIKELNEDKDSCYTLVYYGADKYAYLLKYTDPSIPLTVSKVSEPFTKYGKTYIDVTGSVDSIRLFEKDRNTQTFTGNYIDVTDMDFYIRFVADKE